MGRSKKQVFFNDAGSCFGAAVPRVGPDGLKWLDEYDIIKYKYKINGMKIP